jgi:ATP-dependent helicase/DNAse subunit B
MIEIDKDIVLPEHVSYSAIMTYLKCGYQYFLSRIKQMEEEPSVWLVGGSAVHRATEMYDRGEYENGRR